MHESSAYMLLRRSHQLYCPCYAQVTYEYIGPGSRPQEAAQTSPPDLGWIAQDVQRIAPELVESIDSLQAEGALRGSGMNDKGDLVTGPYLGVKYARAVVLIAEATKELAEKTDLDSSAREEQAESMQSKIDVLEREVQELKAQVAKLLEALSRQN